MILNFFIGQKSSALDQEKYRYVTVGTLFSLKPGLWIRIRMDQHSFSFLDPDPEGKHLRKNRKMQRN